MSQNTKHLALLTIAALMITPMLVLAGTANSEECGTNATRAGTHTMLAEMCTYTTCQYCPSASSNLEEVYNSGTYDFHFVSLVDDMTSDAGDRTGEIMAPVGGGYPTVVFDGGDESVVGGQSGTTNYEDALTTCEDRAVPDVDVTVGCVFLGSGKLNITTTITNNEGAAYFGRLLTYVLEEESRFYNDLDEDYPNHQYLNVLLGFAQDETVSVGSSATETYSSSWDGSTVSYPVSDPQNDFSDIDPENIAIYAVLYADDWETETHGNPYRAYYLEGFGETTPITDPDVPEVYITQPIDGATVMGNVDVRATAVGNSTISSVRCRVGDGSWSTMTSGSSGYEYDWDTTQTANGLVRITIQATDALGMQGTSSVEVTVDNPVAQQLPTIDSITFDPSSPDSEDTFTVMATINPGDATISDVSLVTCAGDQCSFPIPMTETTSNVYTATVGPFDAGEVGCTVTLEHDLGADVVDEEHVTVTDAGGGSSDPTDPGDDTDPEDPNTGGDGTGEESFFEENRTLIGLLAMVIIVIVIFAAVKRKK